MCRGPCQWQSILASVDRLPGVVFVVDCLYDALRSGGASGPQALRHWAATRVNAGTVH